MVQHLVEPLQVAIGCRLLRRQHCLVLLFAVEQELVALPMLVLDCHGVLLRVLVLAVVGRVVPHVDLVLELPGLGPICGLGLVGWPVEQLLGDLLLICGLVSVRSRKRGGALERH